MKCLIKERRRLLASLLFIVVMLINLEGYLRAAPRSTSVVSQAPQDARPQDGGSPPATSSTTPGLQMDIMVPASGIDDRPKIFATRLGRAIVEYHNNSTAATVSTTTSKEPTISTFHLLITRFGQEEIASSKELQNELARLSGLDTDQVVLVHSDAKFSRSRAHNLMHRAACDLDTCLIASMDVDMEISKGFFASSVQCVYLETITNPVPPKFQDHRWQRVVESVNKTGAAYFPIVFSAYNPKSIELVQEKLGELPKYSEHRGYWRETGTGMYVLRGSDASQFEFDEKRFQGWGGEDGAFYRLVAGSRRIVRKNEPGLVHVWHGKSCTVGNDGLKESMLKRCKAARNGQEGSALGKTLLKAKGLFPPTDRSRNM